MRESLNVVFIGLSITSSWGNGHATTYRALLGGLVTLGHRVTFLERDVPWYADNRDLTELPGVNIELYGSVAELDERFRELVRRADAVIVGSYVPDGVEVLQWVLETATGQRLFYDIDTPITLGRFAAGERTYLDPRTIPDLDAYLSFSGGAALERLERDYGARLALPLYCSIDPAQYRPTGETPRYDLGYLGTYSDDRQPTVERLLNQPARALPRARFVVAGPSYPDLPWPENVERVDHVAPADHPAFYGSLRFTLNVTRRDMMELGHSPSVRLFEAAACGVPIITDVWTGLDEFFAIGSEILPARSEEEVLRFLELAEPERRAIGARARQRVLRQHSALERARRLETYLLGLRAGGRRSLQALRDQARGPRKGAVAEHA